MCWMKDIGLSFELRCQQLDFTLGRGVCRCNLLRSTWRVLIWEPNFAWVIFFWAFAKYGMFSGSQGQGRWGWESYQTRWFTALLGMSVFPKELLLKVLLNMYKYLFMLWILTGKEWTVLPTRFIILDYWREKVRDHSYGKDWFNLPRFNHRMKNLKTNLIRCWRQTWWGAFKCHWSLVFRYTKGSSRTRHDRLKQS